MMGPPSCRAGSMTRILVERSEFGMNGTETICDKLEKNSSLSSVLGDPILTALRSHPDPGIPKEVPHLWHNLRDKKYREGTIIQPPLLSPGSGDARLANAAPAPAEDAIEPRARETENEVLLDPSLIAEDRAVKDGEGPASGSGVPAAPGR